MSEIGAELARVSDAYSRPTLSLLHKKHAPVIVAIFRSCFGRDLKPVPTDRLHVMVANLVAELKAAGVDVPPGTGRDLCRSWLREEFLRRVPSGENEEVYELATSTIDAMAVVTSLTRDRQMFGEHRINTILNAVRRFNAEVNPSRSERIEILESEIAVRTAERDRLLAGGDLAPVTDDMLLEGFINLQGLLEGLPGDFQRVREAFGEMRRDVIADFRSEDPQVRDVLQGYITGSDDLMLATAEGRAFAGALTLLTDEALQGDLRGNLNALLAHPAADNILDANDKRNLRSTMHVIAQGISDVLAERNRLTGTLRQRIVTHDAADDKILDVTLRNLETELATWLQTAGARATLDVEVLPSRLEVNHLRTKLYDPAAETPPPPLSDPEDIEPALSMEELRRRGGPSLALYRNVLAEAFSSATPPTSVGELFNRLKDDLRRPVEVFGLVHLAASVGALSSATETEPFLTIRPDGTTRIFDLPRMTLTGAQARLLHAAAEGSDTQDVT